MLPKLTPPLRSTPALSVLVACLIADTDDAEVIDSAERAAALGDSLGMPEEGAALQAWLRQSIAPHRTIEAWCRRVSPGWHADDTQRRALHIEWLKIALDEYEHCS